MSNAEPIEVKEVKLLKRKMSDDHDEPNEKLSVNEPITCKDAQTKLKIGNKTLSVSADESDEETKQETQEERIKRKLREGYEKKLARREQGKTRARAERKERQIYRPPVRKFTGK